MSELAKLYSVELSHTPTVPGGFWRGRPVSFVFSCEHGGNGVPDGFEHLFVGAEQELSSHLGWDPGALELARQLSRNWSAPLIYSEVTRLLVELNRSSHHRKWLSKWSRGADRELVRRLREELYLPYRQALRDQIEQVLAGGGACLHASVHSFTPVYQGVPRKTDLGLLYDPRRLLEKELCRRWAERLKLLLRDCVIRRNHPYLGAADGLTTSLRREYGPEDYLGIEIEVKNDRLVERAIPDLAEALGAGLREALA